VRGHFISTLVSLAEQDPRVMLLIGDLGFTVVEPFAEAFPDRFYNVGVAEQNMVGVATGMAEAGLLPFVYSMATFCGLRPYEFIRNGPVAHQLPVRIVGVGGGFEYGHAGFTHHALEDVGALRMFPELTLIVPADGAQAQSALRMTHGLARPIYFRLGKDDREIVPGLEGRFGLGKVEILAEGDSLLFVTMGNVAIEVVAASRALAERGIKCTVALVSSLNPTPTDDLVRLLREHRVSLTVETHYVAGGLGSVISEIVAEQGLPCRVVRCGVTRRPEVSGTRDFLGRLCGLTAEKLVQRALEALG
jgi:transketolase